MQQYFRTKKKKEEMKALHEYQEEQRQIAILADDEERLYDELLHDKISRELSLVLMGDNGDTGFAEFDF